MHDIKLKFLKIIYYHSYLLHDRTLDVSGKFRLVHPEESLGEVAEGAELPTGCGVVEVRAEPGRAAELLPSQATLLGSSPATGRPQLPLLREKYLVTVMDNLVHLHNFIQKGKQVVSHNFDEDHDGLHHKGSELRVLDSIEQSLTAKVELQRNYSIFKL